MKFRSFLKTQPFIKSAEQKTQARRGLMSLVSVFFFFIFSVLGLSMFFLSQIHLKLGSFKKNSTLLHYASENGVKQGFVTLFNQVCAFSEPSVITPARLDELRDLASSGSTKVAEHTLQMILPQPFYESWEDQNWRGEISLKWERFLEKDDFFETRYRAIISSRGQVKHFPSVKNTSLESSLEVTAGYIPLSRIPLLIEQTHGQGEEERLETDKISFLPSVENQIPPQVTISDQGLIPREANALLGKALKIKMFYPQNLPCAELRRVLGLEPTDDPVPEGVYLIKDDLGLGGLYIHGDVEEMVTAIENDYQVIFIRTEGGCWTLKFSPSQGKTLFMTPIETLQYDLIPLGIIIVSGRLNSLGGGVVDSSGNVSIVKDREIESILKGVSLTIVSSDSVTLSSHLIHQGVEWQSGIPYLKETDSQLVIFATGSDFWDATKREGRIAIARDSPQEIKIQATLISSGGRFTVNGTGKSVHLLGSLQTRGIQPQNNTLKVAFDERVRKQDPAAGNTPKTILPICYVSFFRTLEWREF